MALKLKGSTSGFVALDSPAVAGNNTITLPDSNGSANAVWANDNTAGVTTYTQVTINRNGDIVTPGTLSIGGTITYEDVTNVDSVGLVTAAQGVRINGGGLSIIGVTTGLNAGLSTFTSGVGIADSIFHTGDTNTAIRFPAADTITAETAGTERLRVDSSGRLLLGTTTEGFATYGDKFTIANSSHCGMTIRSGTSSYGTVYFSDGDDGSADEVRGFLEYYHSDNRLALGTNGSPRLNITATGLVGIGTAVPAIPSGGGLEIHHSDVARLKLSTTSTGVASGDGFQIYMSDSSAILENKENAEMRFYTNAVERLRINSVGQISIRGTTTAFDTTGDLDSLQLYYETDSGQASIGPYSSGGSTYLSFYTNAGAAAATEKLRITSAGQLQATSAADVRFTLGSSGTVGTNDSVHIRADSADLKFMAASGGTTLFESNGNETFRITSGGNLGVNCDSPTSLTNSRGITLQGSGGTAAGFINFMDSADNSDGRILADDGQLYIHADISDNTADSLIIFNVDSSEKARINDNGNFTVQRYTVASENTSGDFKITVSGLTNNAGSNWRKCGVFVIYNGINTDATSSRSAVGYYGVGGLTNWSWLGTNEDDVFTADTLPVTLDNATTTSFRLNFNVADGNTGSVTVFVNAWNVRPIVSIAG